MDFDLTDEQRLLKDSVERLMADRYAFEHRRTYAATDLGYSPEMWARYAELGLLALPFAEGHGGIGGGPVETMIVMEAFGAALIVEPYFATVALAGGLLRHAGGPVADELIPAIAAGEARPTAALSEPQSRHDLADVATRATRDGGAWTVTGRKALVPHGDSADAFLIPARTSGEQRDEAGIALFHVAGDAPGLSRRGYPTQDGLRAAELTLHAARATLIAEDGFPLISRAADEATAALTADSLGVLTRMQALTVDYLKTRRQFGAPIGAFQALQHRAVEMFVEVEQSRSMVYFATMLAASDDDAERQRAVSAAKVQVGRALKHVGEDAIQLHGGVGMTMEHAIGHYFKRATMLELTLGNADWHLDRLARLEGLVRDGGQD